MFPDMQRPDRTRQSLPMRLASTLFLLPFAVSVVVYYFLAESACIGFTCDIGVRRRPRDGFLVRAVASLAGGFDYMHGRNACHGRKTLTFVSTPTMQSVREVKTKAGDAAFS